MATQQWSASINLHANDYAIPSGVVVKEVRTKAAGDTTLVFTEGSNMLLRMDAYDIKLIPEGLKAVSRVGTSPALRGNIITLYGTIEA